MKAKNDFQSLDTGPVTSPETTGTAPPMDEAELLADVEGKIKSSFVFFLNCFVCYFVD